MMNESSLTVDKNQPTNLLHADIFVENLLAEGATIACDDSEKCFTEHEDLPPFYNEDLFKKGQAFYHRNIFAIFAGKIFGLISVLAIPSILKILIHTNMSSSDVTAYRRYMATLFHMTIWYESDFKPGSKLWKSIAEVKNLHNSASKRGCKAGLNGISQKDMALTQFGFIGYQVIRSRYLGVYDATAEDWKALIHLWRVVGYLLGIEDRFNICKDSVAETKAICEKLVEKVFMPQVEKKDPQFLQMSRYLLDGLWTIQPTLNFNVIMFELQVLLTPNVKLNKENEDYNKLSTWEKFLLYFMIFIQVSLRWAPFRWYYNHCWYRDFWLMKNFPFLAYYKFGYKNSQVKILGKDG